MRSVFIACADFYPDITKSLLDSCTEVLDQKSIKWNVGYVSGCLELPYLLASKKGYSGYIALGCVIKGETFHYRIVAREASRGIMTLSIQEKMPIINGILCVENMEQARERIRKGSFCASALIRLLTG